MNKKQKACLELAERRNTMYGYYDDFGYGRGMGRGRGMGFGYGHGAGYCHGPGYGFGSGLGRGFGRFFGGLFGESEVETLKRYRDRLVLHKKDLEAELKYVDDRIQSLEK